MVRSRGGSRPFHQITLVQARRWLAGSVVKQITFHCSTSGAARHIIENGIDLGQSSADARWGRGFYSSTTPAASYGQAEVPVAVRLLNPLVVGPTELGDIVQWELLEETGLDDVREAVLTKGYDGVVVHYPHGEIWVVAYDAGQVKVIVEANRHG